MAKHEGHLAELRVRCHPPIGRDREDRTHSRVSTNGTATANTAVSDRLLVVARPSLPIREWVQPSGRRKPLLLLANTDVLHVRVEVDEYNSWQIRPESQAWAAFRVAKRSEIPLTFVRIEPLVIPGRFQPGNTIGGSHSRVLQLIYKVRRSALKVRVGQRVDVRIEGTMSQNTSGRARLVDSDAKSFGTSASSPRF